MTKVSVRLGDLTEAVDHEAALARRTRSEMVRFLIEEALEWRRRGEFRPFAPAAGWVERFEGCPTPAFGQTYQVLDDEWDTDAEPMTRTIRRVRVVG